MISKARKLFNPDKKGRCTKGSFFCVCCEIYENASSNYFAGTHSDLQSLSVYDRPTGRNNQALEGIHVGTINLGASDANNSAKGSVERFINAVKLEEVEFTNRQYQLEKLNSKLKTKRKEALWKDKALTTIVNQHKKGEISSKQLLQKYIARTAEHSLPRELRHLQYKSI